MRAKLFFAIAALLLTCSAGTGVEVSSMNNVGGHFEYEGYVIAPVLDREAPKFASDPGQAQLVEILRPNDEAVTIGRLYTSCTCIRMETEKKSYEKGERIIITVRNTSQTRGQTYPFYVQLTSPLKLTLRYDIYVISDIYAELYPSEAITVQEYKVPPPIFTQSASPTGAIGVPSSAAAVPENALPRVRRSSRGEIFLKQSDLKK